MGDRIPQCTPQECIRAFERLGFVLRRTTGSHFILRNLTSRKTISIPFHARDIKRGLLFGLLKQAGVSPEQFLSVL